MKKMLITAAIAAACVAAPALAQNYPVKPIRFIVPFTPGGGNDTMARMIGQRITAATSQQVLIDNRPGAGGAIGAEAAGKSAADGYTLFLAGVATHGINPNLRRKLSYDPLRDFDAVSLIAEAPLLVVVHPSLPARSLKELVALAKARPGQINFASNGNGSSSHMGAELFIMLTGVKMAHIPYKGVSPALIDLISGEVPLSFASAAGILPQVKAGKLRALAMTGSKRSAAIPDIPTVAEAGVRGAETGSWYGVVMPAGSPKEAINRVSQIIQETVKSPDVTKRLVDEAVIPVGNTPEQFSAHIKGELARWARVVKAAKLPIE